MDIHRFLTLCTPAGGEVLLAALECQPREADFLLHYTRLSRRFPPELAQAAMEIAILRREAASKFPYADKLYFTREALEQASSWEVSSYRAGRYRDYPVLVDLGCSIGGDTLTLAGMAPTLGLDVDPLRLAMARANLSALGLLERTALIQADLTAPLPLSGIPASPGLFFDPARRLGQRRLRSVNAYRPPLAAIQGWLPGFPALGVKISPGVDLEEVSAYQAEVEFISLNGELKEAVLWFGPLKSSPRRATLLPGPHTLVPSQGSHLPLRVPQAYLYEPDPAVLRAGLVATLGERLEAAQLDADIAYLTVERWQATPFARAWAVEAWFPFQLKRLRAYLREHGVGKVTVKKRGSPIRPEALIGDLKLSGTKERTVFLTHVQGRPVAIVGSGPLP